MYKSIYIDFLDYYTLERARRSSVPRRYVVVEGNRAIRLAIMFADRTILPASSFFESELCREILKRNMSFIDLGMLYLSAAEISLMEHREAKLSQYGVKSVSEIVTGYRVRHRQVAPPYLQRPGSSTAGIRKAWLSVLDKNALPRILGAELVRDQPPRLEAVWSDLPERLEGQAFVTDHALRVFEQESIALSPGSIASIIESAYIAGYLQVFNARTITDMIYLRTLMRPKPVQRAFSYAKICQYLTALGLIDLTDHAPPEALVRIRLTEEWEALKSWLSSSASKITVDVAHAAETVDEIARRIPEAPRPAKSGLSERKVSRQQGPRNPTIGIITALAEEFVAAKYVINEALSVIVPGDNNTYIKGVIPSNHSPGKPHHVVLTQLKRMGTNSAASSADALLRSFPSVRTLLMVGIACAVPNPEDASQHVRLGDVVVSDRQGIIQFDNVTRSQGQIHLRGVLPPPAARFTVALNLLESGLLEGKRPWDAHLDAILSSLPEFRRPPGTDDLVDAFGNRVRHPRDPERVPRRPRLFRGIIASSNTLLRDQQFRDWIRDTYKVRAIEMEASGIAEAAWHHEQQYFVIRGTCDYGDNRKNDKWHRYAAAVAAAFMRSLVEECVT